MCDATNQGDIRAQSKLTQVKISVDQQIASAFKRTCAAANVSMTAVLSWFMADYAGGKTKSKAAPDYTTRRKRRAIVKRIISELEQLGAAEEHLLDNAPENLQDAPVYETADLYISVYHEVIEQLGEIAQ